MRRIVLTFTLLSLAFAPAPFPRTERTAHESEQAKQVRLLHECRRRLDELGVKWQVVAGPRGNVVRFRVRVTTRNGAWGMNGDHPVEGGDLAGTLRLLADQVGDFAREAAADNRP
jgi:hypothetical protein